MKTSQDLDRASLAVKRRLQKRVQEFEASFLGPRAILMMMQQGVQNGNIQSPEGGVMGQYSPEGLPGSPDVSNVGGVQPGNSEEGLTG